jgi:arabinofuranosyltransferase
MYRTWKDRHVWGSILAALVVAGAIVHVMPGLTAPAIPFDDSLISFRYADNFVRGRGLVYNPGEPVEGYTNFLWTLLIAVGMLCNVAPLTTAAALGIAGLVASLVLVALVIRAGCGESLKSLVGLVAVFWVVLPTGFVEFAKCGLETHLVCALVILVGLVAHAGPGGRGLMGRRGYRSDWLYSLAPAALILTRLDSAIFVATSVMITAEQVLRPAWRELGAKGALRTTFFFLLERYALLLGILATWFVWKVAYYGDLLPNTYYAKAGDQWLWEPGVAYLAAFVLSYPHVLALAALGVVGAAFAPVGAPRTLALWAVSSLALFAVYVAKVGGDFMQYRFAFEAYPLLCAAAGIGLCALAQRAGFTSVVLASLLTVSGVGKPVMEDRFGMQDFPTMRKFWYDGSRTGPFLRKYLPENVVLSASNAGMAYYSDRTTIDELGLNDRVVAHQTEQMHVRGHVKRASSAYLIKRGVNLRLTHPWDVPCTRDNRERTKRERPVESPLVWLKIDHGDCVRMDYLVQTPELTKWFCSHEERFVMDDLKCDQRRGGVTRRPGLGAL